MSVIFLTDEDLVGGVGIKQTVSGVDISVDDSCEFPVASVVSSMIAVQSGSGDPSPDNIRPITGWDTASVVRVGNNILDVSSCMIGTNQVSSNPTYTLERTETGVKMTLVRDVTDSWVRALLYIGTREELVGKTLTVAADYATSATGNNANMVLASASSKSNYIDAHSAFASAGSGGTSCTGVVPADAKEYIYLVLYLGYGFTGATDDTVEWGNVRVNLGDTAQTWEPGGYASLSAALPETVYSGTLDWMTGLLTVDMCGISLTGQEGWWYNGTQLVMHTARASAPKAGLCSHYPYEILGTAEAVYADGKYLAAGKGITDKYASVADWKNWLAEQHAAGTPMQVVYPLAEPYTIQFAPQQLEMLKGNNRLWTNTSGMSVTYFVNTQMYIDKKFAELAASIINA